ncbi:hypothetical protein VPH35_038793 [Triticum aestivum]
MSSGGHLSVCWSTVAGFCGVLECADDESSGRSTQCRVRQRPRPRPPLRFLSKYPRLPVSSPSLFSSLPHCSSSSFNLSCSARWRRVHGLGRPRDDGWSSTHHSEERSSPVSSPSLFSSLPHCSSSSFNLSCSARWRRGTRARQATGRWVVEHPPRRGEIEYNSQFALLLCHSQAQQAPATHEQEEEPFPGSRAGCDEAARGGPGRRLLLLASRSTFD